MTSLQRINNSEDEVQLKVFRRATRSVPGSGSVWARYIRFLERTNAEDADSAELIEGTLCELRTVSSNKRSTDNHWSLSGVYNNALSIPILANNVDEFVPVALAMAGWQRRRLDSATEEDQEQAFNRVIAVLMDGISKIRKGWS